MRWEEKQLTAKANISHIDISQEEIDFIEAYIRLRLEAMFMLSLNQDISDLISGKPTAAPIGILSKGDVT